MTMTKRFNIKENNFILSTIDELVPENHLVRKLESAIDWNFIYPLVEDLYSSFGRKSIDPVVLFKMIFINKLFGINSMRKTCEEIEVNLAYRWFLGISMDERVPNYSTWSQNYIRRYNDSDVFEKIFDKIIEDCIKRKFIDTTTLFGDSSHQKAHANKRKCINKEVELTKKIFEDELLEEINKERANLGKKPITHLTREELDFDEVTGKEVLRTKTKNIKESTTDKDAGCFHKGEHEECFAYSHQTFCDKNGFVVGFDTVPANVHDSVSFFNVYNVLNDKYEVENYCLDAGYKTPAICRAIFNNNQKVYLPYTRIKGRSDKELFKKSDYEYNEEEDYFICPNGDKLVLSTVDRNGYKIYKSNKDKCANCPLLNKCTKSKNTQKVITLHIWEEYRKKAEELRHTASWKEIYPLRKQTIERVFADDKENHCLRFTRLNGLNKNRHQASIIFTSHNLKKMSLWMWKNGYRRNIKYSCSA